MIEFRTYEMHDRQKQEIYTLRPCHVVPHLGNARLGTPCG
jgi:hypothetical protein